MNTLTLSSHAVIRALRARATQERARSSAWFFKTGEGEYGEGDVFLGVSVPDQRAVARQFGELPLQEITTLLKSKIHECRLTALIILTGRFRCRGERERRSIVRYYLAHTARINNWDLVDASGSAILGAHLLGAKRDVLYTLVRSTNMWERRIAIVSTHALIRAGETKDALRLAELLIADKEDLMHKALGWTLREVGKVSRNTLVAFLKKHAQRMPRTALRYSIEHFSLSDRRRFMGR